MSINWPLESDMGKEQARWNTARNRFVIDSNGEPLKDSTGVPIRGMDCVGVEEFPKMLYKAQRLPNGQPSAGEMAPHPAYLTDPGEFLARLAFIEQFNRSCQRTVQDNSEQRIAEGQGWRDTTKKALELFELEQQEIANAAAQAEFYARRMSATAKREWNDAQDETSEHVVDVVPKKGRGRPRKAVAIAPMAKESDTVQRSR